VANKYGINQEKADAEVISKFSKGLVTSLILGQLQEALDAHKQRARDPEPLRAESRKIEKEIKNLIDACASGAQPDIKAAIDARRARLEHLDGQIKGAGVAESFDLEA